MKNKIIALIISAVLLLASLAVCVSATEGITFSITGAPENSTFEMVEITLSDAAKNDINERFDAFAGDASFYGAYKPSLKDSEGLSFYFTEEMDVTISIGEEFTDTEIFLFYIHTIGADGSGTPSAEIKCVRNGSDFTVSGEDFKAMTANPDNIVVVMTRAISPMHTIVPAVICASVALIAIIASVVVVKKKASRDNITD